VNTCAVKASVSASNGDSDEEEEPGGMGEEDTFTAVVLVLALLKAAVGILQPIMACSAVGAFVGRLVDAVDGEDKGSGTRICLALVAVLSLAILLVVTGGLTLSRRLGAPSLRA